MSRDQTLAVRRIDAEVERMSLLKHPFYQMWTKGELTMDSLRGYSEEYFHLVTTVPALVRNVEAHATAPTDRRNIAESVAEEESHVEMWARFAEGIGVKSDALRKYSASDETRRAVDSLNELTGRSLWEGAAAMYAYESELPKISTTKIDGLRRFYGMTSPEALEYLVVHEKVDIKHAAIWRRIMTKAPTADEPKMVGAATASLKALNRILTSIQAMYVN